MVGLKSAEKGASLWLRFKNLFTISTITIFLVIILAHALIVAIQTHDIGPGLQDIGHRFVGATRDLDTKTTQIIAQKGVYDASGGSVKGVLATIWVYGSLFASLFVIGLWIQIFAKLYAWTLFRKQAQPLASYVLGFITFALIQSAYLLVFDPNPAKLSLLGSPFLALWHLGQALPYLINPIAEGIGKVEGSQI